MNLWNFDEKLLKKVTQELPNSILKEQADILSDKTGGVIYGKVTNVKFCPDDEDIEYNLATLFEIVVPRLDNYQYTLMILYSRPEKDYPVAITIGSNIIDDAEEFIPKYECWNKEQFLGALKAILSSDEVNKDISILYSKAIF